jgi:hypothetical protein
LLLGCGTNPDSDMGLEVINIVEGIKSSGSRIFLSEVAKDIDFIPLETTNECLIGKSRMFFSDKYIVVADWQQDMIFLFDRNGKFIRKIGSKGQGPGEYIDPAMFVLSGDKLFLWDSKMSMLCYDLKTGGCLHEKYYNSEYETGYFNPATIGCLNDSLLVYYTAYPFPDIDPKGFSHLHVTNYDFTVTYNVYSDKYTTPISGNEFNDIQICQYIKDGYMHIWRNDDGIIYRITDSLEIIPVYKLFLGRYDLIGQSNNFGDRKFLITDIQESNNFFFITGIFNHDYTKCIIYDKITKKSQSLIYDDDYGDNFHNDIDGSIGFWPLGYASENVLYNYASVIGLKKIMDHPYVKGIEVKNKEKYRKIKDYLSSADEDNNPIVFLVTIN